MRFVLFFIAALSTSAADTAWVDDAILQKVKRALVLVSPRENSAFTGFFVSEDGLIFTSAAVLEGAVDVLIRNAEGREFHGCRLVVVDPANDLAVLATGKMTANYLRVHTEPANAGEACAVVFHAGDGVFKIADGRLLARREGLDWTGTRLMNFWSVGLNPNMNGLTGAPVVSRDGQVVGMCDLVTGAPPQKFVFAIPENSIAAALTRSRIAPQAIPFPKIGEISRRGMPAGDFNYIQGMKLMTAGDDLGALEQFRSSMQQQPNNPLVMTQVASCMFNAGDAKGAQEILEKAMLLDPKDMQMRMILGKIVASGPDKAKGLQYLQGLVTDFPKLADAQGILGEILLKQGRKQEALVVLDKWTQLEPDSMRAWATYAEALGVAGRLDEAGKARERANNLENLFFKLRYSAPKRY